jgi:hypothetical protein
MHIDIIMHMMYNKIRVEAQFQLKTEKDNEVCENHWSRWYPNGDYLVTSCRRHATRSKEQYLQQAESSLHKFLPRQQSWRHMHAGLFCKEKFMHADW